jgi:hypothetical protein
MKRSKRIRRALSAGLAAALLSGCGGLGSSPSVPEAPTQDLASTSQMMPDWQASHSAHMACPGRAGEAQCLALVLDKRVQDDIAGWAPADLEQRYNLPISRGSGEIVAIVDAYDNPNVSADLNAYRKAFNLGAAHFRKYNQLGQQHDYPQGSPGWGVEIALDVEMVSAACPRCTIYLVEANGAYDLELDAAEVEAVKLGAHVVNNSWICYDSNACIDERDFDHAGVEYVAAAGDEGYDKNGNPESLGSVVSVGGTVLSKDGATYNERVWDGTGGGCSKNLDIWGPAKPKWQHDPDCKFRTDDDISAVAWNVALYDTYGYKGWLTVGGTSVASAFISGVYGLAQNASEQVAGKRFWTLPKPQLAKDLHAVNNDGSRCGKYLCECGMHQYFRYCGLAGWGTPDGIAAF